MVRTQNLIHPGEVLQEELLKPLKISRHKLAEEVCLPVSLIYAIVRKAAGISEETALRLGKYFSTGAEFWCNLQTNYDLCMAASWLKKIT